MGIISGYWLGKSLTERLEDYQKEIEKLNFELENPKIPPKTKEEIIDDLKKVSQLSIEKIFSNLKTSQKGLSFKEVKKRLHQYGLNEIAYEKKETWYTRLFSIIINPLVLLFLFIITVSLLTGDQKTAIIVSAMVILSIIIRFIQEEKAYNEAEKLKSLVKTRVTVFRQNRFFEVDLKNICPGDIIKLSAGDIIPADVRLIESKDLYVNQSLLTGESLPVEKLDKEKNPNAHPLNLKNICLMGTNVETGYALAVVVQTGKNTYLGSLSQTIAGKKIKTDFDRGVDNFTFLMLRFMLFMVPTVFIVNSLTKGNIFEAFLFGISIAVGLTPEMLPAIITLNLSRGSINMAKKKVIIKNLSSIQNLGSMDVLCTDKTGTLTLNKVTVIKYFNINEKEEPLVLKLAFLNSFFQTGFKNLLDTAVVDYAVKKNQKEIINNFEKLDEVPFDFQRKRLSILMKDKKTKDNLLICKGSTDQILKTCSFYEINGKKFPLNDKEIKKIKDLEKKYATQGFRIIAVAYKNLKKETKINEEGLQFLGLITLLDPPKQSAKNAIFHLKNLGIEVKILTGDNELVTNKIAQEVEIKNKGTILGDEIEKMDEATLQKVVEEKTIFARLLPHHKKRIVEALRKKHVVGFLGDGINDAPSLRVSDVGVSVDQAVDIAKESADIILLETDLEVLAKGVMEGRKTFGNIIKYIKMGASSNFGNMFSVLGASIFLPFLPMRPVQILTNNLLYDISQIAIPFDNVDKEYIQKPRKWNIDDIKRFMIYLGPVSSAFDYVTYFVMLYLFNSWKNPALFQTGWFLESLLTQTLIIHVIRSKKMPFFQTWAHPFLTITTVVVCSIGIFLVNSPIAFLFGFAKLPLTYYPVLFSIILSYVLLAQAVKTFYIKKFGYY